MYGSFSLAMDVIVRTMDVEANVADFNSLMLSRTSLDALTKAGFIKPSPVQAQAIPSGMVGLGSSFCLQNFIIIIYYVLARSS